MLFAKENGYKIRVRSGGHNHAGLSSGNGVVVIDVSELNSIELKGDIDSIQKDGMVTITLGPGTTVSEIKKLAEGKSKQAPGKQFYFPLGGCPTVCIGGFALGGGWGPFTRYIGLGCDHLKSITLVDGNGKIKTLSTPPKGDDPLKVFRGGGGCNLGVVTSMSFEFPKCQITRTKVVYEFEYTWTVSEKDMQEIVKVRKDLKKYHTLQEKLQFLDSSDLIGKCEAYKLVCTYLDNFPSDSNPRFTTACRLLSSYLLDKTEMFVVMITGYYVSEQSDESQAKKETEEKMHSLLGKLWKKQDGQKPNENPTPKESTTAVKNMKSTSTLLKSMMRTNEGKMCDPFSTWGPIVMKKVQESTNSENSENSENSKREIIYACEDLERFPHIIDSAVPKREIKKTKSQEELKMCPEELKMSPEELKMSPEEKLGILELIYQIHNKTLKFKGNTTLYATFHSLGGRVINDSVQRIFPHGNNPYIIQIQGWWEEKNQNSGPQHDNSNEKGISSKTLEYDISAVEKWVKKLRKMCRGWCGGKFLNFAGFDLLQSADYGSFKVERPSKEKWNHILSQYYGETGLKELREAKKIFDPDNLFDVFDIPDICEIDSSCD